MSFVIDGKIESPIPPEKFDIELDGSVVKLCLKKDLFGLIFLILE